MSPRAAWRLEGLGFSEVFDYRPGKADWLASGFQVEGSDAGVERTGDVAKKVPTCRLEERVSAVRARIAGGICAVVNDQNIVLGLVTAKDLGSDDAIVEGVMQGGPSTWRPNLDAAELSHHLVNKGVDEVLITTSDGELVGVFSAHEHH